MVRQHTLGPWRIIGKSPSMEMIGTKTGEPAISGAFRHDPKWKANAYLIAAAPDLLAALDSMVTVFVDLRKAEGFSLDDEETECHKKALDAIAKAGGGK